MALVGWWKLNNDTNDSSIYNNNGVNHGATLVDGGPLGKCYSFDGVDDYVDCGNNGSLNITNAITIEAWVKFNDVAKQNTIVSKTDVNYPAETTFWMDQRLSNKLYFGGYTSSGGSAYISGTYNFINNVWYHLVGIDNGINLKLYVNGNEIASSSRATRISTDCSVKIGKRGDAGYYFDGLISDVRIYNHALSLKEIKDLAKCKVLHYTFNQFQEPTTNLLYDNKIINWTIGNLTASVTRSTIEPNYKYKIASTTGGSFRFYIPLTKLINGETYNLSYNYEIKTPDGNFYMTDWCDRPITKIDDGYQATAYGSCAEYSSVYRFMDFYISENTEVEIWNVQLEQKNHATPFVDGSRTGKVYDCSGFNNHSNLTESTTPKWVEDGPIGSGCYEFDGNDYVSKANNYFNVVGTWHNDTTDEGSINGFENVRSITLTSNYDDIFTDQFITSDFPNYAGPNNYVYMSFWFKGSELPNWEQSQIWIEKPVPNANEYQKYVLKSDGQNSRNEYFRIYYSTTQNSGETVYIADPKVWKESNIFTDNINQKWTVCAWVKIPDTTIENVYLVEGFNLGCKLIHGSTRKALLYINDGDNDSYTYSDIYLPENVWFHIAYVLNTNTQRCQIYINGVEHGTSTNYSETDTPAGFGSNMIIGTNLKGFLSDVRIYATDLSEDVIKEIYQSRASIDNNKNVYVNKIKESILVTDTLQDSINNDSFTGYLSRYTQAHCIVTTSDTYTYNGNRTVNIFRTPNLVYPDDGNVMWGGIKLRFSENDFEIGKKYRLSLRYKGKTNNDFETYFAYSIGWSTMGVGLTYGTVEGRRFVSESENINDYDNWKLLIQEFTCSADRKIQYGTDGNRYFCMRELKIGFTYESTGPYGTDLYFADIRIDEIDESGSPIEIVKNGVVKSHIFNSVGPTNGLILYMPLNGDTKDYSGNANNGTNNGATVVQGLGNRMAYSFDGVDDYVDCGNDASLNITDAITIEAWVRVGSFATDWQRVVCKETTGDGYSLGLRSTGAIEWYLGGTVLESYANDILLDTWFHVAVSYDKNLPDSQMKIYVNGNLKKSGTKTTTIPVNTKNLVIGRRSTSDMLYFNGLITDVRIYNRALSQQEISWLYDMYNPNKSIGAKIFNNNIIYAHSFKEGY